MIERLPPLLRRCLALGLLLLLILALDATLFGPWRDQRAALRQQISTDRATIERYQTALTKLEADLQAIKKLQDTPLSLAFLGEASGTLPSAELQDLIKQAGDRERVTVDSLQILPKREVAGIQRQGLAVSFEASFPALVRMIHAIEGTTPLVRLSKLELQSKADADGLLTVALTAEGLLPEGEP